MKRTAAAVVVLALALPALAGAQARVTLTTEVLRDKIKGGWAGQTIGVTFGGPTEFRYNGTMIPDYTPIAWHDRVLPETFDRSPGL
ncbi:MAG TPA: ADP-ribosylglycohydrolase family protein, partial [Vicinamibacterales bacterium]|nr:ADP-ribosylglycohydrolase family protein [Vicinamibacterales bacterium]